MINEKVEGMFSLLCFVIFLNALLSKVCKLSMLTQLYWSLRSGSVSQTTIEKKETKYDLFQYNWVRKKCLKVSKSFYPQQPF